MAGVLKVKVGGQFVPVGPGSGVAVQANEPMGMPEGHLWWDTDEPVGGPALGLAIPYWGVKKNTDTAAAAGANVAVLNNLQTDAPAGARLLIMGHVMLTNGPQLCNLNAWVGTEQVTVDNPVLVSATTPIGYYENLWVNTLATTTVANAILTLWHRPDQNTSTIRAGSSLIAMRLS